MTLRHSLIFINFALLSAACSSGNPPEGVLGSDVPDVYEFESRFQDGAAGAPASSVDISGQIFRHVLINDLAEHIADIDGEIANNPDFDPAGVEADLLSYYEFDSSVRGSDKIDLTTDPKRLQNTYDDLATGKDLASKMAGNDSATYHKDFTTEFWGWNNQKVAQFGGSTESPDGLIRAFFAMVAHQAELKVNGDPSMADLPAHVSPLGYDFEELTEKLLLGAIAFSQAADDYLDEELDEKNDVADDGAPYSPLEHAWDEGFGYFGAARDYLTMSLDDLDQNVLTDTNDDGKIDFLTEYTFGPASYAAKRDAGSTSGTTFAHDAMTAFLEGRYYITQTGKPTGLRDFADKALSAWEKAMAASTAHYINALVADLDLIGQDGYSLATEAKHWSEMKGLALSFQFNPRSPMKPAQFKTMHKKLGDMPVLADAGDDAIAAYRAALLEVRADLGTIYKLKADDLENW